MKFYNGFCITSLAVFGVFCALPLGAALKPTKFPGTFQDVSFSQRLETKKAGYEPYKDMKAYVTPEFREANQQDKDEMCQRDRDECCRRWPDYKNSTFSCMPQITYETYGGKADKCPTFYHRDQITTISCVPTRDHSIFKGWCIDAARKNCQMTQTIPQGEKTDKVFYADWDCESPWKEKDNKCVCSDPTNMDADCQCSGTKMVQNGEVCACYDPDKMHIENKNCVCNKPEMDISKNCLERLDGCPDAPHQDPANCECLAPGAKPDIDGICVCLDKSNTPDPYQDIVIDRMSGAQSCKCTVPDSEIDTSTGKCVCIDRTLDIADGCDSGGGSTPPATEIEEYAFFQCRANNIADSRGNSITSGGTVVGLQNIFYCLDDPEPARLGIQEDTDHCFTPCSHKDWTRDSVGFVNSFITDKPFCTGNSHSSSASGSAVYTLGFFYKHDKNIVPSSYLSPTGTPRYILYTESEKDDVLQKIRDKKASWPSASCKTKKNHWYIYVLKLIDRSGPTWEFVESIDIKP